MDQELRFSKPFDAAAKRLVEAGPAAWLTYAGLQGERAELIDAELTTITSQSDRIMRACFGRLHCFYLDCVSKERSSWIF